MIIVWKLKGEAFAQQWDAITGTITIIMTFTNSKTNHLDLVLMTELYLNCLILRRPGRYNCEDLGVPTVIL